MRILFIALILLAAPFGAHAQGFPEDVSRAEVLEVLSSGEREVAATGVVARFQTLSVQVLEGPEKGKVVEVENTSPLLFAPGDDFFLHRVPTGEGGELLYSVGEPDRRNVLLVLLAAFALVTAGIAGVAGVRSLIALAASLSAILLVLVPALAAGFPLVPTALGVSLVMLMLSMLITHGWNRPTLVALIGSVAALSVAAAISEVAVAAAHLSGFVSDETVYLNFAMKGTLDLPSLLLAGILIGIVGVLNDISVSQAHTVAEIFRANPALSRKEVFMRALKVGQEHLGAVVNTLPLAYAGASLPLLMLFGASDAPLGFIVNREIFAAEVIRSLAGGIALSLSGAIATVLAVLLIVRPGEGSVTKGQEARRDIVQPHKH